MAEADGRTDSEDSGHGSTAASRVLVTPTARPAEAPAVVKAEQAAGLQLAAGKTKHVAIVIVVVLALATAGFIAFGNVKALEGRSPIYLVAIVGTVGGIANNYRKLTAVARTGVTSMDQQAQTLTTLQIYLSPLIGATFAVLLYGVFLSGLLSGDFFPAFGDCAAAGFSGIRGLTECSPATNADAAKALIWAFIAGFGENFVPNFIDGLAQRGAATRTEVVENDAQPEQPGG